MITQASKSLPARQLSAERSLPCWLPAGCPYFCKAHLCLCLSFNCVYSPGAAAADLSPEHSIDTILWKDHHPWCTATLFRQRLYDRQIEIGQFRTLVHRPPLVPTLQWALPTPSTARVLCSPSPASSALSPTASDRRMQGCLRNTAKRLWTPRNCMIA